MCTVASMLVLPRRERDCLVGLVVEAYTSRAEDPGFFVVVCMCVESHSRRDISGV